ncbi:unnamed protein product [Rotaria magnacalcarata]|uniref:Uncharacterized protein n=6 Tax=Rotaria magnacalcarata TaxID=392030 RepID=A0A816MVR9_9BILA|nr:unnamed protein product [Rotaria magnacalcarata]CAF2020186.1 unnamed protein product [Rotaria magnacalcarata]CAF2115561.1 unnamed protein product [Rotaria magnacalcarata]CAF3901540.1 unnamed protein product [Rotaria magnacalcarata]
MVNSKKHDILERYHNLLENNIILTDNFLQWFKEKKIFPDFIFDDIQAISSPRERNKKFLLSIIDNGDIGFTKLVEGLTLHGQPFLGELLDGEDRKASELTTEASERVFIDDDLLRKCPGIDKLRADTREKLKTYLQTQLLKAHLNDAWKSQNQSRAVEVINLKRQHYEAQQKLSETIAEEKRAFISLKDSMQSEQLARRRKEDEANELQKTVDKLQSEFEQRWSGQIKMIDANTRCLFKMNDKMAVLTDWFGNLDSILEMNVLQAGSQYDTVDQLQKKLRQYTVAIDGLRMKSAGTDKLKEDLYEALYTSRYIPIDDRKNIPLYEFLLSLYGKNQVTELSQICTKDALQSKLDRDHANEIRMRDIKIAELNQLNRELEDEIARLKAASPPPPPSTAERPTVKPVKPQWRQVPTSVALAPRETTKTRQTLKPVSVQFGTKP